MKMRSVTPMRIAKIGYVVMSVIYCVVGTLCMVRPEVSVQIISRVLGAAMILFGCIKLIGYFSRDLFRLAFQYDLEFGILLIALGLIVLIKSQNVMNFIFIALGIAVLADGLFKVQIAIDSKKFGIGTWWLMLFFAILTVAAGLLLVFRPAESTHILTSLLGLSMVAEGILNLCTVVSTVKIVRHQRPDVVEIEYDEIPL